jgi:hypothetical protein
MTRQLAIALTLAASALAGKTQQLLFPASGSATGSFNGLHAKSKFPAARWLFLARIYLLIPACGCR